MSVIWPLTDAGSGPAAMMNNGSRGSSPSRAMDEGKGHTTPRGPPPFPGVALMSTPMGGPVPPPISYGPPPQLCGPFGPRPIPPPFGSVDGPLSHPQWSAEESGKPSPSDAGSGPAAMMNNGSRGSSPSRAMDEGKGHTTPRGPPPFPGVALMSTPMGGPVPPPISYGPPPQLCGPFGPRPIPPPFGSVDGPLSHPQWSAEESGKPSPSDAGSGPAAMMNNGSRGSSPSRAMDEGKGHTTPRGPPPFPGVALMSTPMGGPVPPPIPYGPPPQLCGPFGPRPIPPPFGSVDGPLSHPQWSAEESGKPSPSDAGSGPAAMMNNGSRGSSPSRAMDEGKQTVLQEPEVPSVLSIASSAEHPVAVSP
ncbi:uncharacterized protein LOC141580359 [Saimiri boliviensis]|uniref:uncharacterized protein LOC141580359 n=1 Tax=Saimiri boliviensis TaxID=27679 RepID=UPI003D78041B